MGEKQGLQVGDSEVDGTGCRGGGGEVVLHPTGSRIVLSGGLWGASSGAKRLCCRFVVP